jgi:replicative DNA helicase
MTALTTAPAPGADALTRDTIGCPEAETAVLSCVLRMTTTDAQAVVAQLHPEDLVDERHRLILEAARGLLGLGIPADPITVLGELRRHAADTCFVLDGPGPLLSDMYAAAPHTSSAGHYLRIVLEHALRRRIETAGSRLQQAAGLSSLDGLLELTHTEMRDVLALKQRHDNAAPRAEEPQP